MVVARSEGRRGTAHAGGMGPRGGSYLKEWLLYGYFVVQGEGRGKWADCPWVLSQLKVGVPINNS